MVELKNWKSCPLVRVANQLGLHILVKITPGRHHQHGCHVMGLPYSRTLPILQATCYHTTYLSLDFCQVVVAEWTVCRNLYFFMSHRPWFTSNAPVCMRCKMYIPHCLFPWLTFRVTVRQLAVQCDAKSSVAMDHGGASTSIDLQLSHRSKSA